MSELVFGYGSNMCLGRFLDYRVHPERPGEPARLDGYSLRFNKEGRDGSGKGNIEPEDGGVVWGVLYSIPNRELPILDRGEGSGYKRIRVSVVRAESTVEAWAHVAKEPSNDPLLRPYAWYKRFLVEGARAHGVPAEYVAKLEAIEAVDDPDAARDCERRSLTCDA